MQWHNIVHGEYIISNNLSISGDKLELSVLPWQAEYYINWNSTPAGGFKDLICCNTEPDEAAQYDPQQRCSVSVTMLWGWR